MKKGKNDQLRLLLTPDRVRQMLDYNPNTGVFIWKKQAGRSNACQVAGNIRKDGRLIVRIDGALILGARLAWFHVTGEWPKGEVDHIDRNASNDAFENLRDVSRAVNELNKDVRASSKSQLKGIYWSPEREKWHARFRSKHLGRFETLEAAQDARRQAEAHFIEVSR